MAVSFAQVSAMSVVTGSGNLAPVSAIPVVIITDGSVPVSPGMAQQVVDVTANASFPRAPVQPIPVVYATGTPPVAPTDPIPIFVTSGGGWPDAISAGVQAGITLTAYTGPTLINTPGTLVENKIIENTLELQAANITIRNCRVQNSGLHGIFGDTATNVTIEHCDIIGDGGTSVATGILTSGTFTANDISGFALGIQLTGPATIKDNYIHDLAKAGGGAHFDGIAMFGGATQDGILIEHNAIYVPVVGGTSNIFLKNAFGPIKNVTLRNNLCRGGPGYTIPMDSNTVGSSITNVSVVNNVMETGGFGYFAVDGPNYTNISGTGNVDYLTGTEIPFPDTAVPPTVGPISFGAAGTFVAYGARTSTTLPAPVGITNGNLLIAYFALGGAVTPPTPTPPAGWSHIPGSPLTVFGPGGITTKSCVFYKVASGESGDYLFTSAASNSTCGVVCRYIGVDAVNPFSPTPITNTGTGPTATALGFTTVVANTFVIFYEQDWGDNVSDTLPPGGSSPVFAERADGTIIYVADGTRGPIGVISSKSHTCNNGPTGGWGTYLIGLKPA